LIELGASWILSTKTVPVVVPPFHFDDDLEILRRTQHCQIDQREGLDALRNAIKQCPELSKEPKRGATWDDLVTRFLRDINPLLDRSEYWIYALRSQRGKRHLKVFGCFKVERVPRREQVNAVKASGQCYWIRNGHKLQYRGNWDSTHALHQVDRLDLYYHMQAPGIGGPENPAKHDGIICLEKASGTPLYGDTYYRGYVHDLFDWRDCAGEMFAERLGKVDHSWDNALQLVQARGPELFDQFTQREGIPSA
jgi:hypothetical protein